MKISTSRKSGFTLVEIMIVVAIIGLLAAIAIPNFIKARTTSQMNACINNLRQIDGGIQQWALETNQGSTAPVTSAVVTPFLGWGRRPMANLPCERHLHGHYGCRETYVQQERVGPRPAVSKQSIVSLTILRKSPGVSPGFFVSFTPLP